jgi:secreted protein with Ig-like and vWFA domain
MNNDDHFKSTPANPNFPKTTLTPELEARVVAWVLGEASPFEASELAQRCAEQPELTVFKRRIEAVHGLVGAVERPRGEPLRLSPERRAKLLAVIGADSTGKPAAIPGGKTFAPPAAVTDAGNRRGLNWRAWMAPMAACFTMLILLGAVMIPSVGVVHKKSRNMSFEAASVADEMERPVLPQSPPSPMAAQKQIEHSLQVARKGGGSESIHQPPKNAARNLGESNLPVMPVFSTDEGASKLSGKGFGFGAASGGRGLGAGSATLDSEVRRRQNRSEAVGGIANEVKERLPKVYAAGIHALDADQTDPFAAPETGGANSAVKTESNVGAVAADAGIEGGNGLGGGGFMPITFLGITSEKKADGPALDLTRIQLKRVNFQAVPLSQALSRLVLLAEESGASELELRGLKIALQNPAQGDPLVSLTLRNLSLDRVIGLITDSVGYRYEQNGSTVLVLAESTTTPTPSPDSLRVETPTTQEAISTFSLHVSDASFRLAKAALDRGEAPDPQTIRPEEFYNAFDYGDPAPLAREPVACWIEQSAHPFLQQRNLVRIALQVPASGRGAGQPLRLTVLLDTSGSMERDDRVESVRAALNSLTALLGPNDRVSLIGFARTPHLLAESVRGDQAAQLVEIAARTPAEGGTNLEEALELAGNVALRHRLEGAQNRIVLLTDGAANLGNANPAQLAEKVTRLRQQGIAFDACGVVAEGLDDTVLEALTRRGDGRYTLINSPEEADASFARQLAGAFRPAAKDVKVQVRFNSARVARYRLIGFEQHRLKTEDFRNDAVDAAELAAEEAAVALYQIEVKPDGEGELGEVSVRFRELSSGQIVERSWPLNYTAQAPAFNRAPPSIQLAGSAAFLAEKLRGGALAGQVQLAEFAPVVESLSGRYPQAARVQDLIQMFRQTRRLTGE